MTAVIAASGLLVARYRAMVRARRFDTQATALAKQGRLAVYPSALGQEACQVGAARALRATDWLFPTYRDSMAVVARGVDPVRTLGLLRGDWHCGYDPAATRTAPHCTPLATHAPHAVGLGLAARWRGDDVTALVLCGDGATSEGDFHEALNLAALYRAPVVFLVQNNGYAISVPLAKQTRAGGLHEKAGGYGMPGVQIDGNDIAAVEDTLTHALDRARAGDGPTLVEALTYRIGPHTNADDDRRYRDPSEVDRWRRNDPIDRLAERMHECGALDPDTERDIAEDAERLAERMRRELACDPEPDPGDLFAHVYAEPTPQLREQFAIVSRR